MRDKRRGNPRGGGQGGQGGQGGRGGGQQRSGQFRRRDFQNRDRQRPPQLVHEPSEVEKLFMSKTPIDPIEWICMEKGGLNDPCMRAVDILCPVGKGTRGLIVSPPKAGKTTFLRQISKSVGVSDPKIRQYALLIDERPEEVTEFKRSVPASVFASCSDQPYEKHVSTAEALMREAVTYAANGEDVFILLDSLTRLARVHNQFANGNRTMSGGLDSRALEVPRRIFGAARKMEEGGSLTILATALVETGSRMDDVIFQEFKGTGNMELVLFRQAAEQRIFPAMKVRESGTRKEEKLLPPETLDLVWKLRRVLSGMGDLEAIKALNEMLRVHKTNEALLSVLK